MRVWLVTAVGFAVLAFASSARAEWSLQGYLGASHTSPATLTLDRPASGAPVTLPGVPLESRSFETPPYYGYRLGWTASDGRFGVEAELTHLKVFARAGSMGPLVERFSISHGLNLLLANVVWRQRITPRVRIVIRGGAGVAIPHGESRIGGVDQEQYEISSTALQGAAGPELVVARHVRAFVEYKLTTAAPAVSVAGGTISGRYTSQHLAAGMGVAW
jgi:hypothetical protein